MLLIVALLLSRCAPMAGAPCPARFQYVCTDQFWICNLSAERPKDLTWIAFDDTTGLCPDGGQP